MSEYSTDLRARRERASSAAGLLQRAIGGIAGSGGTLLLAAEPLRLYGITASNRHGVVASATAGSHHSYALVPIGLLALLLATVAWRGAGRGVIGALLTLGAASLALALLGDRPDATATGVLGNIATGVVPAAASPGPALYLETLGGALIVMAAGGGLILQRPAPDAEPSSRRAPGQAGRPGEHHDA